MARAVLAKQLFRVVEMRDGVPHTISSGPASSTNLQSRSEALKRWRTIKERNPGKDIQILETEPIVWVSDPDPHPECTFTEWSVRRVFSRHTGRTQAEERYSRKCTACGAEEWTDVPKEYVDKAIEGLQAMEDQLDEQ